uniref:GH16 domain-containing protein n=1 Tax=Chromera velia CCMP2878 TaxID=1169474 RepID=A0A0G4FIN4_9ALVE|eukprot:Cvel_17243.t1-p1 / transcript=Cvel_17243.t1 / gene=Cvel_17243 / organism=Chromera_velia_CCMP2878 / gene_product=hypothetical protein / transcript_product=hypothetical protein / location=Cvel_scaffold1365:23669-26400(+) / protein_length=493 / sequence_SO=supercontig / SO=protein_coding / is_pseudo=false
MAELPAPLPDCPDGMISFFEDKFSSPSLDTSKWEPRTDAKHYSKQVPQNISVGAGGLSLRVTKSAPGSKFPFEGCGVVSTQSFGIGYYEVECTLPVSPEGQPIPGVWCSFWLSSVKKIGVKIDSPNWQEFDVFEHRTGEDSFDWSFLKWKPEREIYLQCKEKLPGRAEGSRHRWGFLLLTNDCYVTLDGRALGRFSLKSINMHKELTPLHVWLTSIVHKRTFPDAQQSADCGVLPSELRFHRFRHFRFARGPGRLVKGQSLKVNFDREKGWAPWKVKRGEKVGCLSAALWVLGVGAPAQNVTLLVVRTPEEGPVLQLGSQGKSLCVSLLGEALEVPNFFDLSDGGGQGGGKEEWIHVGIAWDGSEGGLMKIWRTVKSEGKAELRHSIEGVKSDQLVGTSGVIFCGGEEEGHPMAEGMCVTGVKIYSGALSEDAVKTAEWVSRPDYARWRSKGPDKANLLAPTYPEAEVGDLFDSTAAAVAIGDLTGLCNDYVS